MSESTHGSDSFLSEPPHLTTLVDLMRFRARHQPNQPAYTFLPDGETEGSSLSYGELDRQASAIGRVLQNMNAAGQRVLLLFPPGLEFIPAFGGCLYAAAVAVPTNLPRLNKSAFRLEAIAKDARPTIALTDARTLARMERLLPQFPILRDLRWLAVDSLVDNDVRDSWKPFETSGDTLALLQYTSGSTGDPKGVMLTHQNLLSNASMLFHAMKRTAIERTVSWLPTFHDMGLMAGILEPLYGGFPSVLMSPASFLQRPVRWLQAISRYRATTSGGPNFAFELCAQKVTAEEKASLDLSSWAVACNGSEPIRAGTLEAFTRAFESCGFRRQAFYPCYGLAEATLIVSGGLKAAPPIVVSYPKQKDLKEVQGATRHEDEEDVRRLVGCGRPLGEEKIVIAHPKSLTTCSVGEVGEIWIAGPNVAQGYWNRPDETERTFHAYVADTGEGPFLRSGDLGFIEESELFVTGRLKDLIIIRGVNYYPQDIEYTVESCHAALKSGGGAAFALEADGREHLVVVHELHARGQHDTDALIKAIRRAVAEEHEVVPSRVLLVKPGSVPKTSSGKVQRRACRDAYLEKRLEVIAEDVADDATGGQPLPPLSTEGLKSPAEIEAWLGTHLATRLGIDVSEIDVDRPIAEYGMDSLTAVELVHGLEARLGVSVPLTSFLDDSSIRQLVARAVSSPTLLPSLPNNGRVQACGAEELSPLSWGQRALWFMHRMSPESAAYNISVAARVKGSLDVGTFRRTFQALIDRHASLRTTFQMGEEVLRRIHPRAELHLREEDASEWSERVISERLSEEAQEPFDLEEGPLLRVCLFKRTADEHVLLLVAHHIVVDFWSLTLLMREFGVLYEAETNGTEVDLPTLKFSYSDYVLWQTELLASPEGTRQWSYWQKQLAGAAPVLNLPTDKPRPSFQTYRGESLSFKLSRGLTEELKALGRERKATLFMTLLAAFQVLLSHHASQADIVVGSPASGRTRAGFAEVVGYFISPMPLRADLSGDPRFDDFLQQVRQTVLEALEHQDYPFALMVERLQTERQLGRSPLFQVMFALQTAQESTQEEFVSFSLGEAGASVELGGLRFVSMELKRLTSQVELTLALAETGGSLSARLEYNADIFDPSTAECLADHFVALLTSIVADPRRPISELRMLTDAEENKLLREWNETPSKTESASLAELLEAQAARTPDIVAVNAGTQQITYAELNRRANQLARLLRSKGVGPETLVAICMERSVNMVVGLLGILKAGGAYVPLDPAYPRDRLSFILDDARVALLLTQKRWQASLTAGNTKVLCLDRAGPAIALESEDNLLHSAGAKNLVYVIYTSGSTGKPKGVAIEQRSVVALLEWASGCFEPRDLAGVLASTSICFDLSVFELFVTLTRGGTVIMAENALQLPHLEALDKVTLINTVPSAMSELVRISGVPPSVLVVNLCGEVLHENLARQIYQHDGIERVFNLYGPSEDTVYSTVAAIKKGAGTAPTIGRPIGQTQAYILDEYFRPAPLRVAGELCLGGTGLARGYLNRPGSTAQRFIPNPFSDTPGERLYRTGDLARFRTDGSIEFLGRADHQVKVRGYRIELGEVEAVLNAHPHVKEAAVVVDEEGSGQPRLVAYVVAEDGQQALCTELRDFMRVKLPDYMLPSVFVALEKLPLTPNGKVDRKALPAPGHSRPQSDKTYVAPRTWVEKTLVDTWCDLLGVEKLGIDDDFFEIGGHSLLATQLITRVRTIFRADISLQDVFESPTVAGLALAVVQRQAEQSSDEEVFALLDELESLSDADVPNLS